MHRYVALALVALGVLGGCEDPTSAEAEGRLEATVNGAPWAANYQQDLAVADLMDGGTVLEVVGLRVGAGRATEQLSVVIPEFSGPGTYELGGDAGTGTGYFFTREGDDAPLVSYETGTDHTGTIAVDRMDAQARTISGTFSYTAHDAESGETVTIASGVFDGSFVIN